MKSKRKKGEGKAGTSAVDPMQADHRASFPSMLCQEDAAKGKGAGHEQSARRRTQLQGML